MRTFFRDYSSGTLICGVTKSKEVEQSFLTRSLNALEISDERCHLHRGGFDVELLPVNYKKLSVLNECDVLMILENGLTESIYISGDDAVLFTSSRCNSNCVMCPSSYVSRSTGSVERLSILLEQIDYFQSDIAHVTITGGEPLLLGYDLLTLLNKCKQRFLFTEFLLLTNGRGFSNKEFALSFADCAPYNTTPAIPIHAANANDHDAITQAKGSFRQTIIGIKNLLQLGFRIEIRIVTSLMNYKQIPDIAEFLVSDFSGSIKVVFVGLEMTGSAATITSDLWLPYHEAFDAIKPAVNYLVSNSIDVELYNFPLCAVDSGYYSICSSSISPEKVCKDDRECVACSLCDACGGVFKGSYRLAKKDIRRVISC